MKIIFVAGSKGGIGKSLTSSALITFFQQKKQNVILIDTDTSNPDVYRAYTEEIPSFYADCDNADGWIEILNLCEQHKDATVIINTASRNMKAMIDYSNLLFDVAKELTAKISSIWLTSIHRDSIELLKTYSDELPKHEIHVLKNNFFGNDDLFSLYNASELRTRLEATGTRSLCMPVLAPRVVKVISEERLSISQALKDMPLGNRAELKRWMGEMTTILDEILHGRK